MSTRTSSVARLLVLFLCLDLIFLYTFMPLIRGDAFNLFFWLLAVLPLAAFFPGLIAGKIRAYQWLCFLILIYFIQGILDIFSPDRILQGSLASILVLALYSAAIVYIRSRLKTT